MNNLPLPTSFDLEQSNGSLVIANDSALPIEDIEMQLMNNDSTTLSIPRTYEELHLPPDCCTPMISKHFFWCTKCIPIRFQQRWTYLRSKAHRLVEHRFFEWLIIGSILTSSTTLVSYSNKTE
jgi:hypothetical protein